MEEGDLVLCKVEKVTQTVTTVRLPNGSEATIISSEIAPGRIKFMRHYVVPNKQIVCKVLDLSNGHVHLSLRRVTSKEKKEVMQKLKAELATKAAFKQLFKEDYEKIKESILKDFENLAEFIGHAKKDESLLKKYIPKENIGAVKKIMDKKRKKSELKQILKLKCLESDGLKRIKEILKISDEDVKISYISAGKFSLKLKVDDFKEGKKKINELIEKLEQSAQKNNCEFHASEEK